ARERLDPVNVTVPTAHIRPSDRPSVYPSIFSPMHFSSLTTRVGGEGSDAWMVHDLAVERRRQGEDIILLSIGDPDFATPAAISQAAVAALASGRTHYAPANGEPALRRAVADLARRSLGQAVDPDQVTVFPGAQAALFALAQCLFESGDEVLVAEPT